MKRILCVLLALLLMAASAFATEEEWTFENSFYRWTVVNCEEWISLREEPSVSAKVLKQVPLGAEVIWHDGAGNGFVVIEYEGVTGYALHGYLQGYLEAVRVSNCEEWVSLRQQPDENSERIRKVPLGQLLYSGGRVGDFASVLYEGTYGYIATKHLTRADNGTGVPRYANRNISLYKAATEDSATLCRIPYDAKVMCYSTSERGVCYVNYLDKWGFVAQEDLSVAPLDDENTIVRAEISGHAWSGDEIKPVKQVVTDPALLRRLQLTLSSAAPGYVGKCPMSATLKLEYSDGHRVEFLYPLDGCRSLVGEDSAVYELTRQGGELFWEIFAEAQNQFFTY